MINSHPEEEQEKRAVNDLIGHLSQGYKSYGITVNNYFTLLQLAHELYEEKKSLI